MSSSRWSSLLRVLFEVWFGHWWFVLVIDNDMWSNIYDYARGWSRGMVVVVIFL
jgi:hypothetical protein